MTEAGDQTPTGLRARARSLVTHSITQRSITGLIMVNAVILAMETSPSIMDVAGGALLLADKCILAVFVAEMVLKLVAFGRGFFRDPWNLFDVLVIGIALVPATESMSVLRALRILRVLRLISAVPSLRRVVGALLHAVPGMSSVVALLSVIYFVFAVMATKTVRRRLPAVVRRYRRLGL